jgi:chromosome segregation ATPase
MSKPSPSSSRTPLQQAQRRIRDLEKQVLDQKTTIATRDRQIEVLKSGSDQWIMTAEAAEAELNEIKCLREGDKALIETLQGSLERANSTIEHLTPKLQRAIQDAEYLAKQHIEVQNSANKAIGDESNRHEGAVQQLVRAFTYAIHDLGTASGTGKGGGS